MRLRSPYVCFPVRANGMCRRLALCAIAWVVLSCGPRKSAAQIEPLPAPPQAIVIPEISLTAYEQPWQPIQPQAPAYANDPRTSWDGTPAQFTYPYAQPQSVYPNQPRAAEPYAIGADDEIWDFQILPNGLIYHPYLAGDREPQIKSVIGSQRGFGAIWDVALGGRMALWRYGTDQEWMPNGWELDIEGAVFPRLAPFGPSSPLIAMDYRVGLPLTYGDGPWQYKIGYYHLSSHLGDEWILQHPEIQSQRINYVRDELLTGISYYWLDDFRLYGEMGIAAANGGDSVGGAKPLEFQFGAEYSPKHCNDGRGAPFAAVNTHLRQEVRFRGDFTAQTGWQWRGERSGHTFRLGVEYFTGLSDQGEFNTAFEERVGFGVWYDY